MTASIRSVGREAVVIPFKPRTASPVRAERLPPPAHEPRIDWEGAWYHEAAIAADRRPGNGR